MTRRFLAALATVLILAGSASGQAPSADDTTVTVEEDTPETPMSQRRRADDDRGVNHWQMATFEAVVALAIPAAWYWSTEEHQQIDFTLGTNWDSWKLKFTSTEKIKWDTNPFHVNAIRHPLQGTIDYQILRTNGFNAVTSTVFATLRGAFWEYMIEFREAPSLNDMIMNGAGGVAIGEPMFQLGQLWRGERVTWADRARTAVFSPFDALHDTYRPAKRWWRPRAWRAIDLGAGASERHADRVARSEVSLVADLDLVAEPAYVIEGARAVRTKVGAWSRLRIGARLGDRGDGAQLVGTEFHTSTSLFGIYRQTLDGRGMFLGLGTAFTYRNDTLAYDKDRLAYMHLPGPMLSLTKRSRGMELRWDLGAYLDFALAQALVFSPHNPFPRPPPFYSSLQADGYIDAIGVSTLTRLRASRGPWYGDLELSSHVVRQTVGHDRDPDGDGEEDDYSSRSSTVNPAVTAYGVVESRGFWRAKIGYQPGRWGVALVSDGAYRRSSWEDGGRTRVIHERALGAQLTLAY